MNLRKKHSPSEKVADLQSHSQRLTRRGSWQISKDLPSSFKYAIQGIIHGFISQRNFRIHVVIGGLVSFLAIWLQLPFSDLAILVITIAAVFVLELINTSIEAVVDLSIGRRFHPLARIAKDCAAAAVLVASLSSLLIAGLLLLPAFFARLGF